MDFSLNWNTWHDPLYWWLLSRTHNREEAEDLAAHAFARAWEKRLQLRDPKAFKPWLFRIAANLLKSQSPLEKKPTWERLDDPEQNWNERLSDDENLLDALLATERGAYYRSALATLPQAMRKAVLLASEGFKYREIGTRLEIPMGTVKTRIWAGRKRLLAMNKTSERRSYLYA